MWAPQTRPNIRQPVRHWDFFLLWTPALLLSGVLAWDLNQVPKSPGLSEVVWCYAIIKVKKAKIQSGYTVTWPLFQLSLLPSMTDVRFGILLRTNEKVIQRKVTSRILDVGHSTCVRAGAMYPNGNIHFICICEGNPVTAVLTEKEQRKFFFVEGTNAMKWQIIEL